MSSMMCIVPKFTASYIFAIGLAALVQQLKAESFMDKLLAQQFAGQVASQMSAPSAFNQDDWLSRQHATVEDPPAGDLVAPQATSQAPSSASFSQDAWLERQAEVYDAAGLDLEKSLLSDIEDALGKDHRQFMEGRITAIEESMRPMYQALPKNEYAKMGHSSVRYMLHRFFVTEHGWSIDGLFTEGAALNTSSPSHMLKGRVPMFVQGLFEKRLGGRGFGIHETAVIVAVVEDSIHQEAQANLRKTCEVLGLDLDMNFSALQVKNLIEVYMSGFIMETNMSAVSAAFLGKQTATMTAFYPTWPKAQAFFDKVYESHADGKQSLSFGAVSTIIGDLVNRFGTFHGKQCQGLKSTLQGLEGKASSGCVSLPSFYEKGLKADTNWLFIESPEYLRNEGALDETDPTNPRLLAANYINSPGNCLQTTGYYMVCCHNECDDILGRLERQLGQPSATPADIKKALRVTSSFNGASPGLRTGMLAPSLHRRLQEVADHHGGRVPIHGRLFAQWLHHVYPYECAYPHVSGSKHPQWVADFEEETGMVSSLTDEEIMSVVQDFNATKAPLLEARKTAIVDAGSCAAWQDMEELFAPLPRALAMHELEEDPHLRYFSFGIASVAAISALTVSMLRTCTSMTKLGKQPKMLQI